MQNASSNNIKTDTTRDQATYFHRSRTRREGRAQAAEAKNGDIVMVAVARSVGPLPRCRRSSSSGSESIDSATSTDGDYTTPLFCKPWCVSLSFYLACLQSERVFSESVVCKLLAACLMMLPFLACCHCKIHVHCIRGACRTAHRFICHVAFHFQFLRRHPSMPSMPKRSSSYVIDPLCHVSRREYLTELT